MSDDFGVQNSKLADERQPEKLTLLKSHQDLQLAFPFRASGNSTSPEGQGHSGNEKPVRPASRYEPYNGFAVDLQYASTPFQNAAFRTGHLLKPTVCSICGFSDLNDLKGRGYIYAHLERYDRPLEIHPACKRCHAALHARFRDPGRWLRIVNANYRAGAWFTLLSMDPESQWRPFNETYPEGLPLP